MLCRTLQGHGHWINTLALSTDYVIRTGAFDPAKATLVYKDITDTGEENPCHRFYVFDHLNFKYKFLIFLSFGSISIKAFMYLSFCIL